MPLLSKPLPVSATDGPLTVARALAEHKINLVADIELNFILRIFLDLDKIISLIPRCLDATEEGMSHVERLTYRLSKNLPRYVTMEWMANYVYKNIPLLEFKKIDDPTLVLPPHPELIPRGRRGARGLPGPRGPGGVCARQLGYAMPLKEFVDDVQLNKVSWRECLAQSDIVPVAGYTYDIDDFFPPDEWPGEVVGSCCEYHQGVIRDGLIPPFDFLARAESSTATEGAKSTQSSPARATRRKKSTHSAADRVPTRQPTLDAIVVKIPVVYEGLNRVRSGKFGVWNAKDGVITNYFAAPLPTPSDAEAESELEGLVDLVHEDRFFSRYNVNEDIICEPVAKRYQDDPVGAFMPLRQEYLDETLRWESRGGEKYAAKCRDCDDPAPRFRCRDGCMGRWMFCQSCIVKRHAYTPLHWMEEWYEAGGYFQRTDLKALGLRVNLNHPPDEFCMLAHAADKDFTVIHDNGIHNVAVDFCHCAQGHNISHRQQLMRNGWWPATPTSPQTCATETCLRQFDKINALSKVAVYEYCRALQKLSDSGDIKVPDKRRAFMNIVRQRRHIQLLKRGGRAHANDGVQTTQYGQLALRCPACPQPGRNLPSDWELASAADSFLYRLYLAQDANFRLQNTTASSEARDPPLGDGWAYFVPRGPYLDYIKRFVDEVDISTCSGFAALFLANLKRVLGLRATGVGAVSCSRHNIFRPNGVGDLQKGERFSNMTYILASALREAGVREVLHTYDVSCIFKINLWRRNESLPRELRINVAPDKFISRVPKFHLPAHTAACHAKEALNFTDGAGDTHGETVEQNWFGLNKAAAQTKPMGPGTRQLTLDCMIGHHNHSFVVSLGTTIKAYAVAQPEFKQLHDGLFDKDPITVQQWLQDERDWQVDKSKLCPYEYHTHCEFSLCIPFPYILNKPIDKSVKEVELDLANEERMTTSDGTAVVRECTPSSLIKTGLDIQHSQRLLSIDRISMKNPTAAQEVELMKRARNLKTRIRRYRRHQDIYMPGLRAHLAATNKELQDDVDDTENITLFLPSEILSARARAAVCAPGLDVIEARLREGEAHEALEEVRRALRARTVTNTFRNRQVRGITLATRSRGVLDKISKRVHSAKLRYRVSRAALLRLRGRGPWEEALRELADDDVRALNERALTREEKALRDSGQHLADVDFGADDGIYIAGVVARGESSRTLSWIWYSVPQDPSLSDSVQNEALRVEYLKSKARRDRHREEIRLLLEEMRRVIASNEADAAEWQQRASSRTCEDKQLREGLQSYALEHAARARDRAARLSEKWKDIRHRAEDALALRFDGAHALHEAEARQELDDLTDTLNDSPDDGDEANRTNAWQAAAQQREQQAATARKAITGGTVKPAVSNMDRKRPGTANNAPEIPEMQGTQGNCRFIPSGCIL
ncbi:hypothetical protein EV715DRAFT_211820 [Schizophyllum commune]